MGLFRRARKEEPEEITPESTLEPVQVKSPGEIEKERGASELEYVRSELESKTNHLDTISEKLDKVKVEYDELVGTIMAAKSEAIEKKTEMDAQRLQHQQLLKQID